MARKAVTTRVDPPLFKAFKIQADERGMTIESLANVCGVYSTYFFRHCSGARVQDMLDKMDDLDVSEKTRADVRTFDAYEVTTA